MRLASIAAAAILLAASAAHAQVTARLVANRTSGVAPLAVFLDGSASAATGANSVHDLHYEWNFDDPGSGSWPHGGVSRNEATGPWSGHVFEQPGSYTVRLTVTAPNGSSQTVTRTIQVGSPNAVYSGSNTICFSSSGNFSGCPSGAQQSTTSSFSGGLAQLATGRRLLFRRGDSFSSDGEVDINVAGPGTIGAYGSGAAPRISVAHDDYVFSLSYNTLTADDWRIMDLDFVTTLSSPGGIASANSTASNILFLRLSGSGFRTNIGFGAYAPAGFGTPLHHDISVVECNFRDHRGGSGGNGVYMAVTRMLFLGNAIQDTQQIEHVTRFPYAGSAVISHNYLARPASNKHLIKLYAFDESKSYPFPEKESHNVLISNNVFQSGNDSWAVVIGPKNHFTDERVHDVIVERNLFLAGPSSRTYVVASGQDYTIRNNIFSMTGGSSYTPVDIQPRGIEPAPRNTRVYNNTCHSTDSGSATVRCVRESEKNRGTLVANNLLYAPNASQIKLLESNAPDTTDRNNVIATSSPYVVSDPTLASHFRPASGSSAVNAGANLGWAVGDYAGVARPTSGAWEAGAYEIGGGGGGGGGPAPAAPVLLP